MSHDKQHTQCICSLVVVVYVMQGHRVHVAQDAAHTHDAYAAHTHNAHAIVNSMQAHQAHLCSFMFATSLAYCVYCLLLAMDESDLSEQFKKQLKGMLVCLRCGPLHRFTSGKTHKSRSKHKMREMTPDERAEEIRWYREIQADGEEARLRILEQKRREARSESGQGQELAVPTEYIFDFGQHKSKRLSVVWRENKSYFGFIVNSKMLRDRLILKRAMEDSGIMAGAEAEAAELKIAQAERVLERARDQRERQEDLHPEQAQLQAIQVEEANAVLAGDSLAVAKGQVADLPALRNRQGRRGRKPRGRRGAGSRGSKKLQHCWCCGSVDQVVLW